MDIADGGATAPPRTRRSLGRLLERAATHFRDVDCGARECMIERRRPASTTPRHGRASLPTSHVKGLCLAGDGEDVVIPTATLEFAGTPQESARPQAVCGVVPSNCACTNRRVISVAVP